jgi:hypothetical protein
MSLALFISLSFFPMSARAEVTELPNASWIEVPGSRDPNPSNSEESYDEPAFVDINGLSRKGDVVTFDLVESDASYRRLETDCRRNLYRLKRFGFFESKSRVNFSTPVSTWAPADSDAYKKSIITFVCREQSSQVSSVN